MHAQFPRYRYERANKKNKKIAPKPGCFYSASRRSSTGELGGKVPEGGRIGCGVLLAHDTWETATHRAPGRKVGAADGRRMGRRMGPHSPQAVGCLVRPDVGANRPSLWAIFRIRPCRTGFRTAQLSRFRAASSLPHSGRPQSSYSRRCRRFEDSRRSSVGKDCGESNKQCALLNRSGFGRRRCPRVIRYERSPNTGIGAHAQSSSPSSSRFHLCQASGRALLSRDMHGLPNMCV